MKTECKVTLIDYTGIGRPDQERHAADLLMFTKETRLAMSAGKLAEVCARNDEQAREALQYMATTIRSSWEFIDVIFLIEGVTRATAQQVTRTRTASYAMQSMRVADVRDIGILNPFDEKTQWTAHEIFKNAALAAITAYSLLVDKLDAPLEDARGILPLNTKCNLVVKYNLRNFVELIAARRSLRAQGEYQDIADQMYNAVISVWPWAAPFFTSQFDAAIEMLERTANELKITAGSGAAWDIAKAVDLLRKAK